jgi:gliding motility-associated-like protein
VAVRTNNDIGLLAIESQEVILQRLSPAGQLQEGLRVNLTDTNYYYRQSVGLRPATDGGWVMATVLQQRSTQKNDFALTKLGPDFQPQWTQAYPGLFNFTDCMDTRGNQITFALAPSGSLADACWIGRTNLAGTSTSLQSFQLPEETVNFYKPIEIRFLPDGQRLASVHAFGPPTASNILGELLHSSFIWLNDQNSIVRSVAIPHFFAHHTQVLPDSRVLVNGTFDATRDQAAALLLLSATGEVLWAKTYTVQNSQLLGYPVYSPVHDRIFLADNYPLTTGIQLFLAIDPANGEAVDSWRRFSSSVIRDFQALPDGRLLALIGPFGHQVQLVTSNGQGEVSDCPSETFCDLQVTDQASIVTTQPAWTPGPATGFLPLLNGAASLQLNAEDYCPQGSATTPGFSASDTLVCVDQAVDFFRDPAINFGSSSWFFEDGQPAEATGAVVEEVIFTSPGVKEVLHLLDRGGCVDTLRREIRVRQSPQWAIGLDTLICPGESFTVGAQVPDSLQWSWADGYPGLPRRIDQPGTYELQLSNGECSRNELVKAGALPPPRLDLGRDTFLCREAAALTLSARLESPATELTWDDGSQALTRVVDAAGWYSATARRGQCLLTDSIFVASRDCPGCDLYLPNAFSPNDDGRNDVFSLFTPCLEISTFELLIFDRWGQQLFATSDPAFRWNGRYRGQELPTGVYLYVLRGRGFDGVQEVELAEEGEIILLR